jgi:hypothetical protein
MHGRHEHHPLLYAALLHNIQNPGSDVDILAFGAGVEPQILGGDLMVDPESP